VINEFCKVTAKMENRLQPQLPAPTFIKQPSRLNLLRVREAAFAAQMHPDTVRRWIREGRLRGYGRRGTYRVALEDLLPLIGGDETEKS
jgi:excisionase family DNA binding protein